MGCAAVAAGVLFSQDDAPAAAPAPVVASTHAAHEAWGGVSPFGDSGSDSASQAHRRMTDPLPTALFARSGRIVDLHGLSAADFIAQWSSRARTGDTEAAYKVFQAADLCAATADPLPNTHSDTDRQALLRERAELDRTCAGVTPAQIAERMTFLGVAAQAGNHDAQIDFYMEGPNGGVSASQASADDASIAQWKSQSFNYLSMAAGNGDTFSLGLLANSYDAGLLTPPDPKLALAYTVADMLARNVAITPSTLRNRYGEQLSDADFNVGLELGTQIAAICCRAK